MQETKPLTLRRNFSWTFIGNAVYAGCQWGILVVLAKLGSPEMVGQFTLGLAVTAPIIMFTNLQLRGIQATDAQEQYWFSDYLGLRLISTGLALLIIAIISFFGGYQGETSLVILLIGIAKSFESISDVFFGLIQQNERMDKIAISLIIKGVLSLTFLAIGVYLSGKVFWGVLGLIVAWVVVLFGYDIRSALLIVKERSKLKPRWHLKTLRKLFYLSLPLGIVMMLISLNTNIPRYFIVHFVGERELGIFSGIAYLIYAGQTIEAALGQSASPRFAQYYIQGKKQEFINLLLKLIGLGVLIGLVGIVVAGIKGNLILSLLYTAEYVKYQEIFVWMMVIMTVEYVGSFLCYGLIASHHLGVQVPLFMTVTATSAITCFWLVPLYGIKGAAISLLIATTVRAIISTLVIVHIIKKLPLRSDL
jgi:O-antigen/teichoic acid export membrane protein